MKLVEKIVVILTFCSAILMFFGVFFDDYFAVKAQTQPPKGVHWEMGQWYVNGAYNWEGMNQDFDLMSAAGIKWVRFSFGNHTQSSCAATGHYTKLADALDARGLKGLASISIPNRATTTATQEELDAYNSWLTTMVNCYKDRYQDWEVWNEPNIHHFWNIDERTTDDAAYARSVGYYISYLEVTYNTIKSIDPSANVILGGITQNWNITLSDGRTIGTMTRWMEEFIKQGGYQYIDTWGFHPYADYDPNKTYSYQGYTGCGTDNIKRLDEFKSYAYSTSIPQAHRDKPIWLTEVGFSSTADEFPGNTKGSESVKAQCLTDTWEKFRLEGIIYPPIWYEFGRDNLENTRQEGYSLVASNKVTGEYRLNESYFAYQNLWSVTSSPSPTPVGTPTSTPSPDTYIAFDNFTRTLTGTWSTADIGGSYTYSPSSSSSSDFSVNGASGKVLVPTAPDQRVAILPSVSARDVDMKVRVKTDKLSSGGDLFTALQARNNSSGNYRAVLRFVGNKVYIHAQKYLTSTGQTVDLTSKQEIAGLSHIADNYYWVRGQIYGVNPTIINIKTWAIGSTEPSNWQYTVTDNSSTQITQSGSVGILSRSSSGNTDVPVIFSYDELRVAPLSPSTTPTPGDANGDGKVDGLDYVIWLNHYNQTTSNGAQDGDFNSDQIVDGLDYVIWLINYNL